MITDRRDFLGNLGLTLALAAVPRALAQQPGIPSSTPYEAWMKTKIGQGQPYTVVVQVEANTRPQDLIAAILKDNADGANVINVKSKALSPVQIFTAEELPPRKHSKDKIFQVTQSSGGRSFDGTVRLNEHHIIDRIDGTVTTEKGTLPVTIAMGGFYPKPLTYDSSVTPDSQQLEHGLKLHELVGIFHRPQPSPQ